MNWLQNIIPENFKNAFDIKQIIAKSAFYPASGTDGSHISIFTKLGIYSFVNVDYSTPKDKVQQAMEHDFKGVGYRLIGIRHIEEREITPNGFNPVNIPFNEHERYRLDNLPFVSDLMNTVGFEPFALWALYELDPSTTKSIKDKAQRFSLLHIGGEACATFDATYLTNGINPEAIAIIGPGEGYGDNWTLFTNPDFRLHTMLKMNCTKANQSMPRFLLAGKALSNEAFWPDYVFENNAMSDNLNLLSLYRYELT